jgi:ATP-dependent protease ClpP protease subunit
MTDLNYNGGGVFRISTDNIFDIHNHDLDYKTNTIFLYGREEYAQGNDEPLNEPGVDYMLANRFLRNLHILSHKEGNEPILIRMKTCGGWWEEGMAIHNAIWMCPKQVIILNETHARSMSSLIFQAADKRVMMPDSCFMFHDGTIGGEGTIKQMRAHFQQSELADVRMQGIYVAAMKKKGKFSKWSEKRILEMLRSEMDKKEDVFISAKETVQWGLADEIFDADWKKLREIP